MSGIAGLIDFHHNLKNQLPIFEKMLFSMKHRGPDDEGIFLDDHVCLMHVHFNIFNSKQEKQPLHIFPYTIIFDGQLSNTDQVREKLEDHGLEFDALSECEIILKAYAYYKEQCCALLKGSFALVIYDEVLQEVFLARDALGTKPLFYTQVNQCFYFASEIKTLLTHPLVQPSLDCHGIQQLAYLGPGHISGTTFFKNIFEVKPSSYLYFHQNEIETHHYPSLYFHSSIDSLQTTITNLQHLLKQAVKRQITCDVPFGVFLSGGLDSSIVTAIAAQELHEKEKALTTFSIAYEGNTDYYKPTAFQPSNDEDYVDLMVQTYLTTHTKIIITPQNLLDSLYEVVDYRDEPGMVDIDSALLLACKEAKQQVRVILSGECADEFFGGYPWFHETLEKTFPWSKQIALRQSFLLNKYQIDPYPYLQSLIFNTCEEVPVDCDESCENRQIEQMTLLNVRWFMQTLLDRQDRMSMAVGLEARSPFCDWDLFSYVFNIPWQMKNLNQQEKGILRVAVQELLPETIVHRKKSPFPKTYHPLYLATLRKELSKILDNEHEPLWKIFNREAFQQLLTQESQIPFYGQLMTTPQTIGYYLQINYWLKKYKIKII